MKNVKLSTLGIVLLQIAVGCASAPPKEPPKLSDFSNEERAAMINMENFRCEMFIRSVSADALYNETLMRLCLSRGRDSPYLMAKIRERNLWVRAARGEREKFDNRNDIVEILGAEYPDLTSEEISEIVREAEESLVKELAE